MTREEAKRILYVYRAVNLVDASHREAFDMAIEELEQEHCEDCISRKAVLDYIYNDLGLGDEENGNDVERQMELDSSYRFVKSLPPVTPKPKIGKWIKNEEYDGYETTLTDCNCSVCGERSLLKKSYSMDGQSIVLCPSNYCPSCGAKMEVENDRRRMEMGA